MNKKFKYIISIFIVISLFLSINVTFATGIINEALGHANSWNSNHNMGSMSGVVSNITDLITGPNGIIKTIGSLLNVIVFTASAFLGCRYIWGRK